MEIGIGVRNMGPAATRETLTECARAADVAGIESLWMFDHIAIPPDDAEGSGGLYLEILATLAYLAGCTDQIRLGTAVLVAPYRPPLLTAKWIATIQELSGERMLLGIAPGWMKAEFKAAGADRSTRGKVTDETLAFLRHCFSEEVATSNGQEFLFRPQPALPPILIGGAAPHAINRALEYGEGWLPMGLSAEDLKPLIADYRQRAAELGKPDPNITTFTALPPDEPARAQEKIGEMADAGVNRLIQGIKYASAGEFTDAVEQLTELAID